MSVYCSKACATLSRDSVISLNVKIHVVCWSGVYEICVDIEVLSITALDVTAWNYYIYK